MLLLATHQLIRTRSALLYQTKVQMARLDMVFAEQTGRALESVDLLLHSAAESYRRDPSASGGLFNEALRRRMVMVHQTNGIGIVDAEGRMLFVTSPAMEKLEPSAPGRRGGRRSDRGSGGRLRISPPFRLPDGTWTALMVRCTPASNGVRPAAAVALLNLSYFEDFYKAVELTEKGAILLHLRDGTVLARYPHDDRLIGTSFADLPPFRDILDKGQIAGTLIMDSPMDGSTRVLAIRALKAFPVAVNVSVEQYRVLGLWRRQAVLFSLLCACIGFVTAGLVWILAGARVNAKMLLGRLARANARMANEMKERERVERALRQAQRAEAIGRITGGVAHDFNNLLAIVMGNIDLMERTLPPNETTLNRLATMRAAVERGATLTSQLLAFARRQPLMPRPADVGTLVAGLQNLVQSAIGSRIQLVLQLPPRLPPATLDPAQIELVLLNLAINARDAMPDGGTLTISAEHARVESKEHEEFEPGEYVVLSVTDTGVGMEPEVAARAFEPFFTTKEVGRGSGLGLSQVYGVAQQLGGGARLESVVGLGTTVHVYLPLAAGHVEHTERRPIAYSEVTAAHILVVDDDEAVRTTTAALLAQIGYDVYEASSGAEALDALDCEPPIDVLLTDVVMPSMTGPELARRARMDRPDLPIVFITGYSDPDSLSDVGVFAHLVRKPAKPDVLIAAIERALGKVAMARAAE